MEAVAQELPQLRAHLEGIDHLPGELMAQLEQLENAAR
jgi:hypothetical protein